ncbi:unnamed protein product [Debaryomyces tyrocola]|nr:unnamed protein product [Debaryomyces tyrocola]
MLTRYILQLLVLISIAHAQLLSVQIYAKPLSSKPITLGSLHYDKNTTHASFTQNDLAIDDGNYCIGTTDLPNLECFTYTKLSKSTLGTKLLLVHLNADKNIAHLSMSTASVSKNPSESPIQVAVSKVNYDPKPIKNTKPEKTQTNPEATEEESPKSWIQKNWMYVVPPLLIMFVLLGEDEKK